MTIYIGTAKGLFTFPSSDQRPKIDFEGQSVFAIEVSKDRVWASPFSEWSGHSIMFSDNQGADWQTFEKPLKFPESCEASVAKVWQIQDVGDEVFFGVEPAAIFRLDPDAGDWEFCEGLWNHPHRAQWGPGYGGLCLNTILRLSDQVWVVGISTGGVYRTENGGRDWEACNSFIKTPFLPEEIPEFGQCVHKIAFHSSDPDTLFLQHHWGVYRSTDAGKTWHNISEGKDLPSDFGFVCVANQPKTAFIIPINSDQFRIFPEGRMRVFRTVDSGESWHSASRGLPESIAYDCVLRDSFHADGDVLAFGTTSGSVFLSVDNGENWTSVANNLPRITCVRVG